MKLTQLIVRPFVILVERYYPDPFVFAIILTFLTVILSVTLTDTSLGDTVIAWGNGLPGLFEFTTQICLALIGAHALSHTTPVQKLLVRCGSMPDTPFQAYALIAILTGLCSLIAWSLCLVAGGILARQIALQCQLKGLRIHYPLLVAAAYSGMVVWHMGYSGSATLSVATPGHPMEDMMGTLPVTETMLLPGNIGLAIFTVVATALCCAMLRPRDDEIIEVDAALLQDQHDQTHDSDHPHSEPVTLAEKLDSMRAINISIGLLLLLYLGLWFYRYGFALNLNIVIWSFVSIGLLLANSPVHYLKLLVNGSGPVALILLQYPFYAGILGIMKSSGLVSIISSFFTEISTPQTLPFFAFLSGGLINMFVPSGGGQWVIQGPIFLEAAANLGVEAKLIVLGVAYGDQWTNMIQPFWTIPVLAIAGLHLRQIMGYTFMVFLLTFFIFSGGLLFLL